jgi:UDP-2-acetamido-2-deoxy-ribo-hexuluronate aminotransferase
MTTISKVPFIDLKRITARVTPAVMERFKGCLTNADFISGSLVEELETKIAKQLGVKHCVCCTNGTAAITVALQVAGIGAGSKVAIPNLTFWATYEAVAQWGAQPVLLDIDPDNLQMSLEAIAEAHTENHLDAVVYVHLFGWTSPFLEEMRRFCSEQGIKFIEDAAQAFGVELAPGRPVLAESDMATLSFYPAKVLGGCMDGGAVVTNDAEAATLLRTLCNHGRSAHYSYSHVGWNFRMGALQAAYMLEVLPYFSEMIDTRHKVLEVYRRELQGIEGLQLHHAPTPQRDNGYLMVMQLADHDPKVIAEKLTARGVGSARTYPETIDMQAPAHSAMKQGMLKNSHAFCSRVINLPVFAWMTVEEAQHCSTVCREILCS